MYSGIAIGNYFIKSAHENIVGHVINTIEYASSLLESVGGLITALVITTDNVTTFTNNYTNKLCGNVYAEDGYFNGTLSSSVLYTGKISADQINGGTINGITIQGGTIRGGKYYNIDGSAYFEVGNSSYGDFNLWGNNGSRNVLRVFDSTDAVGLSCYSNNFLNVRQTETYARGAWNFSGATVTGLNITTTAVFA